MQRTEFIWHNGKFVPWHEAQIHVLTHSLHYGGAAFEGIRFYNTAKGPAIFRLDDHIKRLFYSASILKMNVGYTQPQVIEIIKELLLKNSLTAGYIRPIIYYGYTKLGVSPVGNPVELSIACWPWGAYLPEGVKVKSSKYIRMHHESTNIKAKLCGNYINGVLASLELAGTKYQEALMLDSNNYISEGVGENVFFVKNGVVYTPKLGTILPGITRDTIIRICKDSKLKIIEKNITLKEAYKADEAFFTGTAAEVSWIQSIDNKTIGAKGIGPITSFLGQNYKDILLGLNKQYLKYLTYVT